MDNVVQLRTDLTTPAQIVETLQRDLGEIKQLVVLVLGEDGSPNVLHSSLTASQLQFVRGRLDCYVDKLVYGD